MADKMKELGNDLNLTETGRAFLNSTTKESKAMPEYIDRNLIEWYGCNFEDASCENRECSGCSHAECSHSQVMQIPKAEVLERSTMKLLCTEYLSKCNCCDECCAEYFCIENQLRTEKRDCVNNLEMYFTKRNIGE